MKETRMCEECRVRVADFWVREPGSTYETFVCGECRKKLVDKLFNYQYAPISYYEEE